MQSLAGWLRERTGARALAAALVLALSLAAPAAAQDEDADEPKGPPPAKAPKGLGEPAPRLAEVEWLLGKPLKQWARGTTYIVLFFSAADTETRRALALCERLQREQAAQRVAVVGLATLDRPEAIANAAFLGRYKDQLPFAIARDKLDKTVKAWDAAFALGAVPRALVVDKTSRVAWSGHPFDGLEAALAAVLSGEKGAVDAVYAARRKALEDIWPLRLEHQRLARLPGKEAKCAELAAQMVAIDRELAKGFLVDTYLDLAEAGLAREAAEWGARVIDELAADDEVLLNELAWAAVDPKRDAKLYDIPLASRAAGRAVELSASRNGALLDTLARARWLDGLRDEAVKLQAQALEAAWSADERTALQKTLDTYRAGG